MSSELDRRLEKIQAALERYQSAKAELMALVGIAEDEPEPVSQCPTCGKKMRVSTGDEGTSCYVCDRCDAYEVKKKVTFKIRECCGSKGPRHKAGCSGTASASASTAAEDEASAM